MNYRELNEITINKMNSIRIFIINGMERNQNPWSYLLGGFQLKP